MNKIISSLAVSSTLLLSALAAEPGDLGTPHITVTGTAVTESVPDRLLWSLEIKNTGLELPKVAEKHAAISAEVLKTLMELGIAEKDTQTAQMEFGENLVYRDRGRVKEGYFASTKLSFKLGDLSKYKAVWLRLAAISSLSVQGVTYDHSKRIELRKETRKKALLAAKEKAAAMAEVLNAKTGDVLSVTEDVISAGFSGNNVSLSNTINSNGTALAEGRDGDGETGGALAPGTIPISIRVVVSFRLLNAGE